ncbi:metal-dependent transcriptional regulator [Granulicella sp. dw_53]|uniref:metal-dependent transcriptional regulator n=1 Tax=Granulicella sp. dw_53 TaxID=2719792 RepID=UPI001BD445C7|nr:metal-dependent transcriptional regulator [Granulicella sp. dw_53]
MPVRRRTNGNSESVDNYLKAILSLGGPGEHRVTSTALAERLGVAPASITNMLQKLAGAMEPLVEYERHRGVKLSSAGKRRALEVVRHHRLIETFLYKVLDYPIEEVHDEAERLEHFISERFEERIAAKLGHPTIDPHGHFIPTMEGEMPAQASIVLTEVVDGGTFLIDSVDDRDAETLKALEAQGIKAGARLKVKRRTAAEGCLVSVGRSAKALDLSREMAGDIRIVPVGS